MESNKSKKVLKKIAAKHGVSIEEVRRDIRFAVSMAENNPDPKKREFLNSIPRKGEKATPEEVIAHLSRIIDGKKKR